MYREEKQVIGPEKKVGIKLWRVLNISRGSALTNVRFRPEEGYAEILKLTVDSLVSFFLSSFLSNPFYIWQATSIIHIRNEDLI